jgi:hypothetical protein
MKKNVQICPWCQTEIVWEEDEEEPAECPNCFNELGDYRTLMVDLDGIGEEDAPDLYGYEQKTQAYLDHQDKEQTLDCDLCQEAMIASGELKWQANAYQPYTVPGLPPFLEGPVRVQVQVCPSCFQVKFMLPEDIRMRIMQKLTG